MDIPKDSSRETEENHRRPQSGKYKADIITGYYPYNK